MAMSQCLDDSSLGSKHSGSSDLDVYNEVHRLALEELLSGGVDNFLKFLMKEQIHNFLSDDEIHLIRNTAVAPECVSIHGEEDALEQSHDCSSVTYLPEAWDVEPPMLDMGWPAFTAGSYRGVTRAVAHFQPSNEECIYSCKEAARRMIKGAKEVIAIVTDSLTDLDIFKDLQEACCSRRVPVYILLDQLGAPAFLKMCRNVGVCVDNLRQMRVRTITGMNYYMRSGARVTGEVHERFMLIDGTKVATGSYRFNWTDGKLNTSNLIELTGQITEKFDEEFCILYAQSLPLHTQGPPRIRNDHQLIKHLVTSSPQLARQRPMEMVHLTSTPSGKPKIPVQPPCTTTAEVGPITVPAFHLSSTGNDCVKQQNILAGSTTPNFPADKVAGEQMTSSTVSSSIQTRWRVADSLMHTNNTQQPKLMVPSTTAQNQATKQAGTNNILKADLEKLTKERQLCYSTMRYKLEHMMHSLSQRRELASRIPKDCGQGPSLLVERMGMGTWPRARCVY
ncbi:hypothetical protein PAMA_010996 [Pampus argenteus]